MTRPLDAVVGRVLAVSDHPGSRAPSFLLRVDLGSRGEHDAQMEPGGYTADALVGTLVVVTLAEGEAIVMTARSHARGSILVRPDSDVDPGTVVA